MQNSLGWVRQGSSAKRSFARVAYSHGLLVVGGLCFPACALSLLLTFVATSEPGRCTALALLSGIPGVLICFALPFAVQRRRLAIGGLSLVVSAAVLLVQAYLATPRGDTGPGSPLQSHYPRSHGYLRGSLAKAIEPAGVPVWAIHGERDRRIPLGYVLYSVEILQEARVDARCIVIKEEDHFMMFSQRRQVVDELVQIARGLADETDRIQGQHPDMEAL